MKPRILSAAILVVIGNAVMTSANLFNRDADPRGLRGRRRQHKEGAGTKRNERLALKEQRQKKKLKQAQQQGGRAKHNKLNKPGGKEDKPNRPGRNNDDKKDKLFDKKDKKDKPGRNKPSRQQGAKNKPKPGKKGDKPSRQQGGKKPGKKDQNGKNKPSRNQGNKDKPSKRRKNPYRPRDPRRNRPSPSKDGEMAPRIIGGSEASPNSHPYVASLSDSKGHFCGGSLITKKHVLTAAHCQGAPFDVILGRHNLNSNNGQKIGITKQVPHPRYDDWTTDMDFMVVVLDDYATLNNNVKLVELNSDNSEPKVGGGVTVMGWGDTDISESSSKLSDVLMKVNVNCMSNKDCEASSDGRDSYEGQITDNMLCAKANRQDSCQGDSGGPLVDGRKQVGVVSWGIGCADPDFPGVYARISKAHSWIKGTVCDDDERAATEAGFDCKNAQSVSASNVNPAPSPPSGGGGGGKPPSPSPPSPSPPSGGDDWYDWDDDYVVSASNTGGGGGGGGGGDSGGYYYDDDFWAEYFPSYGGSNNGGGGGGGGNNGGGSGGGGKWDDDYDDYSPASYGGYDDDYYFSSSNNGGGGGGGGKQDDWFDIDDWYFDDDWRRE